ncbi:MAG: hypothetical protein JO154_11290 [Chitinophaga sp.]|uniref:hypothetical protein n=1 Tax=Chitinophaga sp. TaxID=1869181 RepID=UPI0025C66134|nr:hypothetical protein [Chitinophaga sp.]MBV8253180.1 hypothetical protein [Chitinophaga sp.]
MKKVPLPFVILLCFSLSLAAQHHKAQFYKGKEFRGYIFDTTYHTSYRIEGQKSRIDLSIKDIEDAEKLLKRNLGVVTVGLPLERFGHNIVTSLAQYYRQYFGYTNWNGDTIIWINLSCNEDLEEKAALGELEVMDGGSCYWNIEVNITTQRLSNLSIHGLG